MRAAASLTGDEPILCSIQRQSPPGLTSRKTGSQRMELAARQRGYQPV